MKTVPILFLAILSVGWLLGRQGEARSSDGLHRSPSLVIESLCKQSKHFSFVDHVAESKQPPPVSLCICSPKWQTIPATLRLNTTSAAPLATTHSDGFHDLLALEVFCRIGQRITMTQLPGKASLRVANSGIDDGTVLRIANLPKEKFPNLYPVPESMMVWDFVAFTQKPDIQVHTWSDLAPYNVAFNNGWVILERNVRQAQSITKAKNTDQLFGLLSRNRADVIIYEKWQGLYQGGKHGLTKLRQLTPPLASKKMYMYMHKRHKNLIPKLSQTFKAMKATGVYWPLYFSTLAPLIH